jgi:hypothetical protein
MWPFLLAIFRIELSRIQVFTFYRLAMKRAWEIPVFILASSEDPKSQ